MDKDDLFLGILILVSVITLAGAGFMAGRLYERQWWQTAIPQEMDKLCKECANLNADR